MIPFFPYYTDPHATNLDHTHIITSIPNSRHCLP